MAGTEPGFRDPQAMTKGELTDPDYRLKQLSKVKNKVNRPHTCSRCHHCRR